MAVLIGPRSFSATEDFAVAYAGMQRGPLVGAATAGSSGQPLFMELPGAGAARIGIRRDVGPDGRAFVGIGVQPTIAAAPTVADVRAGRDAVLERAVETLRKQPAALK